MTLEEAIKHCEEVAERYDRVEDSHADDGLKQECIQCAADHRQLAEWLRELKDLREIFAKADTGKATLKDYLDLLNEWAEMKRLLKAAVEDINFYVVCDDCYEAHCDECCCDQDNHCHWKHEAEALALIGEEANHENPT